MCERRSVLKTRKRALQVSLLLNFFKIQAVFQGMIYIFSVADMIPSVPLPMMTGPSQRQHTFKNKNVSLHLIRQASAHVPVTHLDEARSFFAVS